MEVAQVTVKQLGVICEPNFILLTKIDWIEYPESQTESPRVLGLMLLSLIVS